MADPAGRDVVAGVSALGARLADEIGASGPIGIDRFMAASLDDPEHGYYRTRDPLGAAGDFVTAPEISQVFGEIVGAWLAEIWRQAGSPDPVLLVELGPGRGTLAADILRIFGLVPGCRAAVRLHLVETSPALRERQRETLAEHAPEWHESFDTVPEGPLLLVANEFFDALPIRQFVRQGGTWRERLVGLDSERLAFLTGPAVQPPSPPALSEEEDIDGTIYETCEPAWEIAAGIGRRLARCPGAALVIDYGHAHTGFADTLQAVRSHRPAAVLDEPGETDLTAHVDFQALAAAFDAISTWGPVIQGRFLVENGALLREATLIRGRDTATATAIRRAIWRLLDPAGMGTLFKVMAVTSPGLARPAGF